MKKFNLNNLFQYGIITVLFPAIAIGSVYQLFKPFTYYTGIQNIVGHDKPFIGEDNFAKTKTEEYIPNSSTNCKIPMTNVDEGQLYYASSGNMSQRMLNILPNTEGSHMQITLDSPGVINFEKFNSSSSIEVNAKFCNTLINNITPVAVSIYFGPKMEVGAMFKLSDLYKVGTYTGNKMYISIPNNEDVYVTTDNDQVINNNSN